MKTSTKAALITLATAVPAFLLGPVIWPLADIGVEPTAAQLPLFLFLAVGDALLLGGGVAFLVLGWPVLRRVSPDSKVRATVMFVSIAYLMVSWWPHLNMHGHNGFDLGGLLLIDYLFHLPLEVAGVALALSFMSLFRARHRAQEGEPQIAGRMPVGSTRS